MARPKGSKNKSVTEMISVPAPETLVANGFVIPTLIEKLPIDYGREDLNNMAKKINELIEKANG